VIRREEFREELSKEAVGLIVRLGTRKDSVEAPSFPSLLNPVRACLKLLAMLFSSQPYPGSDTM